MSCPRAESIYDNQRHASSVRSRMKLLISRHQFSCPINRKGVRSKRATMIDVSSSLIRVTANETKGTCCEASSGDWWARDQREISPPRLSSFENRRESRVFESCHCTGCSRLLRVLAELHRTVRVKKLAFGDQARGSGARGSRVFCSRNTVSGVSHGQGAYSQLSRPSFSSRLQTITTILSVCLYNPPRTTVRIKFPPHTAGTRPAWMARWAPKSPEFVKSMAT